MDDYVSRDDVWRFIAEAFSDGHFATNYDYAIVSDKIGELPAADVQSVIYAHKTINVGMRSYCSNCGKLAIMEDFCSKCGAKVKDGDK